MTECTYCESKALDTCDACGRAVCEKCGHRRARTRKQGETLCNPDPATWPGLGCYRPSVAEVAP